MYWWATMTSFKETKLCVASVCWESVTSSSRSSVCWGAGITGRFWVRMTVFGAELQEADHISMRPCWVWWAQLSPSTRVGGRQTVSLKLAWGAIGRRPHKAGGRIKDRRIFISKDLLRSHLQAKNRSHERNQTPWPQISSLENCEKQFLSPSLWDFAMATLGI